MTKPLKTELLSADLENITAFSMPINKGAGIINWGGLVAFPTETVYGLGANAFDADAAKKIYAAKGRPSDNPLIVHVCCKEDILLAAEFVTPAAEKLIDAFCPGPLTIILNKSSRIPVEITGGLDTVAVRIPDNPVALSLIKAAGVPVAAPSANSSGKPSPTRASHVLYDLGGKIDLILDGGPCRYGIESTIIDMTVEPPVILRPGSITKVMLEDVIGDVVDCAGFRDGQAPKAPGMKYTHYSPKAEVNIITGDPKAVSEKINAIAPAHKKCGVLCTDEAKALYDESRFLVFALGSGHNPASMAANLYKLLRKFDYHGADIVYAACPEGFLKNPQAAAISNRLQKAAGGRVLEV